MRGYVDALAAQAASAAGLDAIDQAILGAIVGWETCFESAASLADRVGRSVRSVFYRFARLKAAGHLVRDRGDRGNLPKAARLPARLRSHGYAISRVVGPLALVIAAKKAEHAQRKARADKARQDSARAAHRAEMQRRQEARNARVPTAEPAPMGESGQKPEALEPRPRYVSSVPTSAWEALGAPPPRSKPPP